jgi:hypothetical protein
MREALDLLPSSRSKFSTRVWEIQAAAKEGKTRDEWYHLPHSERVAKVAVMVVPGWLAALDMRYPGR